VAALTPTGSHPALVWGILIGAEIPDIDFLIKYFKGPVFYLKHHRGPTHGFVVLPIQAALIAAVLRLIWPEVPFAPLFWWTLLGTLSHVLFDFGNDYGTQGLWPFSGRRIATDLIPIIDVWLLGLIGGAWLLYALLPGPRQPLFYGLWVVIAGYVGFRYWRRKRAAALLSEHFNVAAPCPDGVPCGPNWRPQRLTIHPTLFSLNAWRYVIQSPGEFLVGMVWVTEGRISEPQRARNQIDQVVKASYKAQVVTAFSDWARRPRVEVAQRDGLYHVRWSDMRYEVDGFAPFSAYAWLDKQFNLVDEGLGKFSNQQLTGTAIKQRLRKEMGKE
jgi:inner membrane protein